jgi:AraC-like DNA-binding protein
MEGETENVLHERGFNIEYAPLLRQTLRLRAGQTYTCVEFHLSPNAFVDWMSFFKGVEEFLHRVKMQQPSRLGRKNGIAGAELLTLVDDLLYCTYTAAIRRKYLTYKLMELLFLSLDQLTGPSFSNAVFLSEISVARIYEARDILIGNLARRYTLKELGSMVGLNPWQLKTGFKAIFSLTIADYLQETRMQKARLLLEETDLPVARIADIVGYTHPFAFSSAFRKYYGYAPSLVRKGRRTRKD